MEREPATVVVTASYNTAALTSFLLWSLHAVLSEPRVEVLVVDNGSTDGSTDMLGALAEAGVCSVAFNERNIGHGPALNQAIAAVAARPSLPDRIWLLDSDCVIARGDALSSVLADSRSAEAAIVGEAHWDPWLRRRRFELYSLILDRRAFMLVPEQAKLADGGDPSIGFLDAAAALQLPLVEFPFTALGYVIHRGRGTLAAVAKAGEREHPLYEWAVDHQESHFGGVDGAADRYHALAATFRDDVAAAGGPFAEALRAGGVDLAGI